MVDINDRGCFPEETEKTIYAEAGLDERTYSIHKLLGISAAALEEAQEKLTNPIDFLSTQFAGRRVFRFVATHPDLDHLSGLYRLHSEQQIPIDNFWDIAHQKTLSKDDFAGSPYRYEDWCWYLYLSGRLAPQYPSPATVIRAYRGDSRNYWAQDGISILHPSTAFLESANRREDDSYNDCSYVLRIQYGESTIMLGGDAEESSWADIWQSHTDDQLSSSLLKASHHGRESGYHKEAVRSIAPTYTIFSAGKKPSNDAHSQYQKHGTTVLRTHSHGTITATCYADGKVFLQDAQGNDL